MPGSNDSGNFSHGWLDSSAQLLFAFDGGVPNAESGLDLWRDARRFEIEKLAAATGLSIGHRVRVTPASGPVVEGRLLVEAEELWLHARRADELRLRIGNVDFGVAEIESCVRLDANE
jgi:hypothetical protein